MNKHAELVEEARELADGLSGTRYHVAFSRTLRALADIVEAHDKGQADSDDRLDAILDRYVSRREVFDELLVACKTCNEVIQEFIGDRRTALGDKRPSVEDWIKLDAARYSAKRAAEGADTMDAQQVQPPVKVEMRVQRVGRGSLTNGYWIAGPAPCLNRSSTDQERMRRAGEQWLADLSRRSGVTLVPDWSDKAEGGA